MRDNPEHGTAPPLTYRHVLVMAWPIVLANIASPLLGMADTAVIGNSGTVAELGAIALGAQLFNFMYWGFGFLRMSTTGFTAQAAGAQNMQEVSATFARAAGIGLVVGLVLLLAWSPIVSVGIYLLGGSEGVQATTREYAAVRIWGAPATLGSYALLGTFIGLGQSKRVLQIQVLLNSLNIGLDVLLAGYLDLGATGVALGTAISEWCAFLFGLWLLYRQRLPCTSWAEVLEPQKLKSIARANSDIMIRTLLLLLGFAWFASRGAAFSDATLAGNHLLLQFVSFAAFFLDGFAFSAESLVGKAMGARDAAGFRRAVRLTTRLAVGTSAVLATGVLLLGPSVIQWLTDLEPVKAVARAFLPYASLYVLLSFAAFQLDGIFIGCTRTREMRNAALLSSAVLFAAWWLLLPLANAGLWIAFTIYVVARAGALLLWYPSLLRRLGGGERNGLA